MCKKDGDMSPCLDFLIFKALRTREDWKGKEIEMRRGWEKRAYECKQRVLPEEGSREMEEDKNFKLKGAATFVDSDFL